MTEETKAVLAGTYAKALMQELASWGKLTTIVLHGGCVFEFKGPFPKGAEGSGYYNLKGTYPGFEGHISLEKISQIQFQDKPHRGKESYAFVFANNEGECIFKVFLGRDDEGDLLQDQVQKFKTIQKTLSV